MTTTAPYGSWTSPISASDLAAGSHAIAGAAWIGGEVWWLEQRPAEGGRYAVRTRDDGGVRDVLPAPWNARSRVHEYGGGAWAAADDGTVVFVEFADQRLYRFDAGADEPEPLTPAEGGFRFGELALRNGAVVAVRETHDGSGSVTRDIVAVPLDGAAASDPDAITSIVAGSHFVAAPRFSPDGTRLAWIAWEHPRMPWDGTELRVGDVGADGRVTQWRTVLGSETKSVLQPEWAADGRLVAVTDASGWWNPVLVDGTTGGVERLLEEPAEYAGPLWMLGTRWYDRLDPAGGAERLLAVRALGTQSLVIVENGATHPVDLPFTSISLGPRDGDRVLVIAGSPDTASGLHVVDLRGGSIEDVRSGTDLELDARYLPRAELRTFTGERDVHTIVFPPRNGDFAAPEGELPPYVAFVHGGPTGSTPVALDPTAAYFTSRGIGVVAVNYGGSTGYGREYRERLRAQWGVVDVEDVIAAVRGLADTGLADGARLAIRGGSAGGWTVLAALTGSDAFAAGASYFGVAELVRFAETTHDFESRYLDGLVGPLPETRDVYEDRAPLNRVDRLATPVLLLQGLDDPIVPPSQAEMFVEALRGRGIPWAYRAYEGESHGFRRAETNIDALESELSFYGQVLGFAPPGVPVLPLER